MVKRRVRKIKDKKNLKGLSTIVATLLIILLTLVAVGIIWVVVRNVIQGGSEQISLGKFTLNLEISQVQRINDSALTIAIKRDAGKGDFVGISFIAEDYYGTEVVNQNVSMSELQTKTFSLYFTTINVSRLKKISIVPIFRLESGKEVVGDVKDTYSFASSGSGILTCAPYCPVSAQCGSDGCGGVCGTCSQSGYVCSGYACVEESTCTDTCSSLGYGCGYHMICGTNTSCGGCGTGYECSSLTSNCTALCDLTSATWNQTSALTGGIVRLNIAGTNCNGRTISFEILEKDGFLNSDDSVTPNPSNIIFSDAGSYSVWNANYTDDTDGGQSNPPEYYFIASVVGYSESIESSNSGDDDPLLLTVTQPVSCGINGCQTGETCSNCPADCGVCPPVCGNSIIEGTELCDYPQLNGATCATILGAGYTGTLNCSSSCTFVTTGCIAPCTDTCSSLGYQCGTRTICGTSVSCGTCGTGYTCQTNGTCTAAPVTLIWTSELLTNGGFELGSLTGWTTTGTTDWEVGINPLNGNAGTQAGSYCAYAQGTTTYTEYSGSIYQDVDVSSYASYIDSGTVIVNASGWGVSSEDCCDYTQIQIIFLNSARAVISTPLSTTPNITTAWWKAGISSYAVPAGTRYIRVWGNTYEQGWDGGSLDSFSVRLRYGGTPCTDTCSSLGYTCGTQTVCGVSTNCGTCSVGYNCVSGSCAVCTDTCSSLGYTCGTRTICGASVNCGTCGTGYTCQTNGTCIITPSVPTYYISTTGTDSSSVAGSVSAPWRTLAYACSRVTTSGSVIHVNSGIYTETVQCNLAVGVSIEGEGASTTTIISHYSSTWETNALISLTSATINTNGNQHISGIAFDGDNLIGFNALYVQARGNVAIYNCIFRNFYKNAVTFDGSTQSFSETGPEPTAWSVGNRFYNNIVSNSALYDAQYNYNSGALQIGVQEGMRIYNNSFTENTRGAGEENGYCIKYYNQGFNRDLKIYNNTIIRAPQLNTGNGWNFAIELWRYRGGVEIYDNYIEGSIDVDHVQKGSYAYSLDIHDNIFGYDSFNPSTSWGNHNAGVYIEFGVIGPLYVRDNTFRNLEAPITFVPRAGDSLSDIYIYNNIFNGIGSSDIDETHRLVYWAGGGAGVTVNNLNFVNNVAYVNNGGAVFGFTMFLSQTFATATNINVRNNVFQGFTSYPVFYEISSGESIDYFNITNNIFYGNGVNSVSYDGTIQATHLIISSNPVSNPSFVNPTAGNFHLLSGSPAINAGINVPWVTTDYDGVTRGNPPEIGAFEY